MENLNRTVTILVQSTTTTIITEANERKKQQIVNKHLEKLRGTIWLKQASSANLNLINYTKLQIQPPTTNN